MKFLKMGLLALLLSGTANAGLINFDFSKPGNASTSTTLSFTQSGYTLTVIGRTWLLKGQQSGFGYQPAQVEWWHQGLGIKGGPGNDGRVDGDEIYRTDKLFLYLTSIYPQAQFSSIDVTFGNKWASKLEEGEQAHVWLGYDDNYVNGEYLYGGANQTHHIDVNGQANEIIMISSRIEGDNGFRVKSISIDVPEPTSLALLGLALIGFVARKKV